MSERVNNIKTTLILMIIEANTLPKSKLAKVMDSDVAVEKNKTGKFAFLASLYFQEVSGHAVTDEGYYTISYVKEVYDWLYKEALELKAKKQLENSEKTLDIPEKKIENSEKTKLLDEYNALKNAITEKMQFIVATRKNPPKDILNLSSKKASNGQRVLVQDYDLYEELIATGLALDEAKNKNDMETFLANLSRELVSNLSLNQDILNLITKYNPSLSAEEEKPLTRSRQITLPSDAEIHASVPREVKPEIIPEIDELEVREEEKGNVVFRENVISLEVDVETVKVANAFRKVIECLKTPRVKRLESPTLTSRVEKLVRDYIKAQENYLNPEFVKEIKELLVVDSNLAVSSVEVESSEVIDQEILKVADAFRKVANCLDATQVKRLNAPDFKGEITELAQEYLAEKSELISPEFLKEVSKIVKPVADDKPVVDKEREITKVLDTTSMVKPTINPQMIEVADAYRRVATNNWPQVKELTAVSATSKQELLKTAEKLRQVGEFLNHGVVKELEESTLTSRQEILKIAEKLRQAGEFLNHNVVKELEESTLTSRQETLKIAEKLRQTGEFLNHVVVKELEESTLTSRQEILKIAEKLRQAGEFLNHVVVKELEESTLTSRQETLKIAEKLRQAGEFLNHVVVKELEESTLTSRQETLNIAEKLRQVGEFLNQLEVKELTSMTLTSKQESLETAEKLRQVASKLGQTDYKMLEVGNPVVKEKAEVKPDLGMMMNFSNLIQNFHLYDRAEKVSDKIPESHTSQGLKAQVQVASQLKKHEAKLIQVSLEANKKLNVADDLTEYLLENRELIRKYSLQKQQFDSKDNIDENSKNASDILDCLIDILKVRIDDDDQLIMLDRGQMIRISDITIYYRLQGFLEQIQNNNKTVELEKSDIDGGKRLAKPKHLKASLKRKKILRNKCKFNLNSKLFALLKNYWKPVLCGVGAGLTLFLATLGIQNPKNKQDEVSISYEQNYDLNNRTPYDILFKYPFGTMNNIMGDYATKDYYLINLNGTVYLTTRQYDANTGYISYYDARNNMELVGKCFIGSIINPDVQEEKVLNYGYGAKIIQEAVVSLDKIIPYKYFSQYEFDWLISNMTLMRKAMSYNTNINNKDFVETKLRKMQKIELIYNDTVVQEIDGYRISEDESSLDYYCFYDVKTGSFYRVDGDDWNLTINAQDMVGSSFTVNDVSKKMNANNILILNSTFNSDILNTQGDVEDYYCLVFYKANSDGSLVFKDVFNKDAVVLVAKGFSGLTYIDESKGVKIYTTADLLNNNILANINEFFAVYGYNCFQTEYAVEDVINSINSFKSYIEMQKGAEKNGENAEGAILASDIMIFDTTSDSVYLVRDLLDHLDLGEITSGDYYKSNISLDYASGRHKKYYFLRNTGVVDEYNSAEYIDIFDEYSKAVIGDGLSWAHYYTGTDAIGWSDFDKEHRVDMGVKNINIFLQLNGLGDLVKDYYTIEDLSLINDYLNNRNLTRKLS